MIKEISPSYIIQHDQLLKAYADESKGELCPMVNPDIEMYNYLQDSGVLKCLGLFEDDKLIGFLTMMTVVMPHYRELATTIESFFVDKDKRKYGAGLKLINHAEKLAKELGSKMVFMSAPQGSALSKVGKSFGYTPTNITYSKKMQ